MVKCPECDKSVSQPRLDAHMATHVAKSVTCNECSFEAASSHSLEQVWQNHDKILTKFWQNYDMTEFINNDFLLISAYISNAPER